MSKEKRRVPKLRFPGFTEDWEQRKLESLFTKYEDKVNTPNSGYWRLGLRSHCKGTFHTYIDAGNELETAEMNRVKSGNFILNITFAWERALAVTNDEDQDKLVSHRFPQFKPNSDLVIDFFKHTLMDKRFKHHLELSSPGGAGRNKVLKVADMLKYELLVPSIKEQNEISSLLNHVDYIITLHQRKLDNLKLKKKALLQKLFPKNGERYPELRFPGFTDAWEQRKADYIFKSVTDKGYPELPVLSASQELGMVYRDQNGIDIQHDKKNETSYKRVLPGQFVIHLRSFQGGFAYSEIEGITSPAYTVMSFKNSSEQYGLFWKHVFKSEIFIKRLETITYGIRDGRSISFSDFKSLLLQYPSFSEQKLIGDSIAVIERGITLHQRKLDHLQLQKKALLQQMFV